jgi:hypothetical protein
VGDEQENNMGVVAAIWFSEEVSYTDVTFFIKILSDYFTYRSLLNATTKASSECSSPLPNELVGSSGSPGSTL